MTTRKGNKKYNPEEHPSLFSNAMLNNVEPEVRPAPAEPVADRDDAGPGFPELSADGERNPIRFMSFGSGSSGNCSYVGDRRNGFLIDAGIDARKIEEALASHGIAMTAVRGVCITHDHGDHVRYLYSLLRNHRHLKLYCTPKALNGMLRRHSISPRIKDYHRAIYKEFEFTIGNFTITPFEVMHDGTDNCGYHIVHTPSGGVLTYATDLGCVSERVEHYAALAHYLVLESNYDLNMLLTGPYPDYLKSRIRQDNGHLDNAVSARFVARIYRPELRYVFLCHLSKDNNSPDVALTAHRTSLLEAHPELRIGDGTQENVTDLQLMALPRFDPTRLFILG